MLAPETNAAGEETAETTKAADGCHVGVASLEEARRDLDCKIRDACLSFERWNHSPGKLPPPRVGIKAPIGLGKSTIARRRLLELRERLIAAGAPSRLVVLVPSHALADEAASAWRSDGVIVAVLRGYSAKAPGTRTPLCRDLDAVAAAVRARLNVHETVCSAGDRQCTHFDTCPKQVNRLEVERAEVVFASHQALFTGLPLDPDSVAAVVIDEGFWATAVREPTVLNVPTFTSELSPASERSDAKGKEAAELHDLRTRAVTALRKGVPLTTFIDRDDCRRALWLEKRRLRHPGLRPGMSAAERKQREARVEAKAWAHDCVDFWQALPELLLDEGAEGSVELALSDDGDEEVVVRRLRHIHPWLSDKPILHIDGTLRAELASAILPRIVLQEVEANATHMSVRLVLGSFGKGSLCHEPRLKPTEAQRRSNRLRETVEYVAWQARRFAPERTLVITYKGCESAFSAIPSVETGHFNAVAGLNTYEAVRLLVVVGRPLPSDQSLIPPAKALLGHTPESGYVRQRKTVLLRDGSSRGVEVAAHSDTVAELLRSAICDDEILQAIGRGRGINRSAADPLEVHLLADVALPIVHDEVVTWASVQPDLMQRMLLSGIAVDSAKDAADLHPNLFSCHAQAEAALRRGGFNRQTPIRDVYRDLPVKSAAYRKPGRGRSWQRALWIEGDPAKNVREALERSLGPLAGWKPIA